jgi:hypothetical protein
MLGLRRPPRAAGVAKIDLESAEGGRGANGEREDGGWKEALMSVRRERKMDEEGSVGFQVGLEA